MLRRGGRRDCGRGYCLRYGYGRDVVVVVVVGARPGAGGCDW